LIEAERLQLAALIEDQERLLVEVATDPDTADAREPEYLERHQLIRARLAPLGRPCYCVVGSLQPWRWTPHPELEEELDRLRTPLRDLLTIGGPTWRLVLYRRNGLPTDLPFLDDFALTLGDEHFEVLDTSLERELAVLGTSLMPNRKKMHGYGCTGSERPKRSVPMYKIEEGAPSVRVVLRVFFETAPDHRIVLLHGYDKGADDSDARERREADVACGRALDLQRQLDDPARAAGAVATPWST
jgi:hypothetical protein